MSDCDIWVVKLGGSLAGSEHLDGWMNALATCGGRVIVVPGGGPFADSVRAAQESMGLQDAVAHHMALLAMEQFGRALASLKRGYRIAASVTAIHRALRDGRVAVWAPAAMVLPCNDIPASWDISSDSLAAWLAGRLGVKRLLLVKHGAAHEWPVSAADLAARDIVDVAFPRFLADSGAQAFIAPPERYAAAAAAIGDGGAPGARIDLHDRDPTGLHSSPWPRSRRRAGDGP
jgi:aspartokinase-like uncharacterized kinase